MNRKMIFIASLAALVALLLFAGLAWAQTTSPWFWQGMMGGSGGGMMGGYGGGMMGGGSGGMMGANAGGMMNGYRGGVMSGEGHGQMHDLMHDALASGLGLSRPELESRLSAGETLVEIAASQGISQAGLSELFTEARQAAMEQAVADGYLTQEQAEWMLGHMGGSGLGHCPFADGLSGS